MHEAVKKIGQRKFKAFIGLDGFVDEVVHVVDQRQDEKTFTRIETISGYADRIREGGGLSTNIEIVPVTAKMGGNGPIYAYGLKKFGVSITYAGCIGLPDIHPIFKNLAEGSCMIGLANPGMTDAMEFKDGKIIRSKLNSLNLLTWDDLKTKIGTAALAEFFDMADVISLNNWTMIPHMSDIWMHIQQEVIPFMKSDRADKIMFFDLADPRKRSGQDILDALELISGFQQQGFLTALGLNLKEARLVGSYISREQGIEQNIDKIPLEELVNIIQGYIKTDCLTVHPVDCAACILNGTYAEVPGPYCENPVLTTGAGDVFNSGFVLGLLNHLAPEQCLLLGTAASGYYVRTGEWAGLDELKRFLNMWLDGDEAT